MPYKPGTRIRTTSIVSAIEEGKISGSAQILKPHAKGEVICADGTNAYQCKFFVEKEQEDGVESETRVFFACVDSASIKPDPFS